MDDSVQLTRSYEHYKYGDGFAMKSYISRPSSMVQLPGIVFIYEPFGINSEMQRLADEIAKEGYAVMIPDLLSRGSWFSCMRSLMWDLKRGKGQGVDDLIEARNWLAGQAYLAEGRVAVMGLCMGGGFALLLAKSGLFRVSAPFYGEVPENLDGACPIIASYGARDQLTLPHARKLAQEIERLNIPSDLKIYPDAGHSFMNKAPNRVLGFLGKHLPAHAGYNPEAATDATKRLIAFLKKHL